ncbi:hypothetical protein BD410DRAFT_820717 [Rickenella mellea]|uniref:mRNA decay factor PAT1 domain-containing protein n=1 Tax=Rickenella mellea TaxID=50990 RepID=A0A4Y7Q8X2_9AGAM|nr:hypothetical protein BD410DRAFT_820717 [Rickenella mellea]
MSFFGFEHDDLEDERKKFLDGNLREEEDIAVYNWGQDDFDGLGNALQEGNDELNDETFGGNDPVGKDFDFVNSTKALQSDEWPSKFENNNQQHGHETQPQVSSSAASQQARHTANTLDSVWDNKSPFSVLPRSGGGHARSVGTAKGSSVGLGTSRFSPFGSPAITQQSPTLSHQKPVQTSSNYATTGMRTLQEIEAEMIANARQQARMQQVPAQQQRPPRMRSQSPSAVRHEQHLNNIAYQQQILEQQERLRMEELERQLREQRLAQELQARDLQSYLQQEQMSVPSRMVHSRQSSGIYEQQQQQLAHQRLRSHSPAILGMAEQPLLYSQQQQQQQGSLYAQNVQNLQMQQRILSQLAQEQFSQGMAEMNPEEHEALRQEAIKKIMEAERMEGKRRRKAAKIAHMSRYNDLMTQSDKDFITRIQVSQLVTSDPYAEDFYAQVYGSLLRSRMGMNGQDELVLKFGSGEGVGLGLGQRTAGRRPNAMQRMEQQVERIVSNARQREKEKGLHAIHSLQGALGKTAGRSYKAAPRQLLQVETGKESTSPTLSHAHAHISKEDAKEKAAGAAKEAARRGREALGITSADSDGVVAKDPLSHREALFILEGLFDTLLQVEQLRREQPPPEDPEAFMKWEAVYKSLVQELWDGLRVMVPLETSVPHPFVSLITPAKGKRLIPRLSRHLDAKQMRTILTLLVACFSQLDVVIDAPILDSIEESPTRKDVDRQTQVFLASVVQSIMHITQAAELRLISGLLGLFMDRCDVGFVAQTTPGLSLLTLFLSRVAVIKEGILANSIDSSEYPSTEDSISWQNCYNHLFHILTPHFLLLFPSTRIATSHPGRDLADLHIDGLDLPVWQFFAALALQASNEQQQILVATLRDKLIDNLVRASKGWVADESDRRAKIANVNIFLHALGLDSSQINL